VPPGEAATLMEAVLRGGALAFMTADGTMYERRVIAEASPPRRGRRKRFKSDDKVREWLDVSDLATIMREGVKPPEMLLPGWLQRAVLHWFQGEPEDGKSWVAAWCAAQVIRSVPGARVLWMDSEMGDRTMAERLVALELAPHTVERQFVHVNLSLLPHAGFDVFREWVTDHRFDLLVWDSMAQHFAGADVNDDRSNSEIAWWIAELVNPVSQYGGTTVCVDHLGKAGQSGGYARGGGAKKARARVVYEFKKTAPFDRETIGQITVAREKNSDSAEIPKRRSVQLGGTPFVLREFELSPEDERNEKKAQRAQDVRRLLATLKHQAKQNPDRPRLSFSRWVALTPGKAARLREIARELMHHPHTSEDGSYAPRVRWEVEKLGTKEVTWVWLAEK
jgi:hypothetical protein